MNKRIFLSKVFIIFFFVFSFSLSGEEKETFFGVIGQELSQRSWVQTGGYWQLNLLFDDALIRTYFKKPPKEGTFLGLSADNKPTKQEILFLDRIGRDAITLTESQYERFGDGSVCWAFKKEKKFRRGGQCFAAVTTAIIDDLVNHNDEHRYTCWKSG